VEVVERPDGIGIHLLDGRPAADELVILQGHGAAACADARSGDRVLPASVRKGAAGGG